MNIIFITHPSFLKSQSMPRFAKMLADGMKERGHKVEVWSPQPVFFRIPVFQSVRKWLGYIDQYLIFPVKMLERLNKCDINTLFVFTDQALGPWVPLVANRTHIIHCHDFLAQRSAMGEIPENHTRWTGRRYQAFIRHGYAQGKHFISVSEKTREDLHMLLPSYPVNSVVVYNGLNKLFKPLEPKLARSSLSRRLGIDLHDGYLLHVGGNQWYKNRSGVIEIYNAWRSKSNYSLPLVMIGEKPSLGILRTYAQSPYKADIHFFTGIEDKYVCLAYAGASVFVFPSLAEGFGWPIAEAMASGCPVITTDEAPMTEVAGNAGFFISRRHYSEVKPSVWATEAAKVIDRVLKLSPEERNSVIEAGLNNVKRFDLKASLDQIEEIYKNIMKTAKAV